jgi:hypothetical protein
VPPGRGDPTAFVAECRKCLQQRANCKYPLALPANGDEDASRHLPAALFFALWQALDGFAHPTYAQKRAGRHGLACSAFAERHMTQSRYKPLFLFKYKFFLCTW